ncbi:EpsG family protein [Bacteroides fragilis]
MGIIRFCYSYFLALSFFFQTKVILKYSPLPLFSLFFLWSISFANVFYIRQTVAIALLFYSTTFLVNKKTWLFFICIYIATLFHSTSFVFVFAYFLFRLRITIKQMFFFFVDVFSLFDFFGVYFQ